MSDYIKGVIVGNSFSLRKASNSHYSLERDRAEFTNKIFSLDYVLNHNASLHLRGKVIDIKPVETFKSIENDKKGNFEDVLEELKKRTRVTKKQLKLPVNESYAESLADDPEGTVYSAYLEWLEKTTIEFSSFVKPDIEYVEAEEVTLDSLRLIIKEEGLGLNVSDKNDTIEEVEGRIEEARKANK